MICGQAQIVGLAPSLGAPSMTSYSLGLPALWPDDSIGMDSPSPGDPAVSLRHSELTTARRGAPNELTSHAGACARCGGGRGFSDQRSSRREISTSPHSLAEAINAAPWN